MLKKHVVCITTFFLSGTTFVTIIRLVMLDKLQMTLVTNDNHSWMERIINKVHVHPFTHPMCTIGAKTWLSVSKVAFESP